MIGFEIGVYCEMRKGLLLSSGPALEILGQDLEPPEIEAGVAPLSITLTGSTYYNGTFDLDPAALSAGPICLVDGRIFGLATEGERLIAVPGLWVYRSVADAPVLTWQWIKDGADIANESSETYDVGASTPGTTFSVREIATNIDGTRMVTSTDLIAN